MTDVFDETKSMMRANFPLIYLTTTETAEPPRS